MTSSRQRAKQISSDLERSVLSVAGGIKRSADENSRLLVLAGIGLLIAQWIGWIDLKLPSWWPLVFAIVGAAGITGYVAGDKIAELIPREPGILLVAFQADGKGGEIWELHEDTWAKMDVDGTLYEWSESPRRIYECRSYDPDENHAIANWRESEPASSLADGRSVEDALTAIRELRNDLEPEAAKAREMRRRIRGIVRQLDRQRAEEMDEIIDELTVDQGIEDATISNVLDESLPDELHPHAGGGSDGPSENGHKETDRFTIDQDEFDAILDEEEPIPRGL